MNLASVRVRPSAAPRMRGFHACAAAALTMVLFGGTTAAASEPAPAASDDADYVHMHLTVSGLFSATRPVIAILGGNLYLGEATGHLGGDGTLAIHAQKNPSLRCTGEFTSSAALGGNGTLACNDGSSAVFRFDRQGVYRGHGTGTLTRGSMSFTYGMTLEEASPYLKLPEGKKLVDDGSGLAMVDR